MLIRIRHVPRLWQTILRFISLDEADIRRLAKSLRQKIQEKGASEKAYRKLFPKLATGKHLDRAKLHELLHENFRVSLNERDVQALFKYMDVDGDGEVSAEDFILFLKHSGEQFEGERGAQRAMTIVDVAVSLNAEQEAALAQLGYQMSEVSHRQDKPHIFPCHTRIGLTMSELYTAWRNIYLPHMCTCMGCP